MSEIEIIDILEDKVKHLVTDLKNAKKLSYTNESSRNQEADKIAKVELKIKNLLSILFFPIYR